MIQLPDRRDVSGQTHLASVGAGNDLSHTGADGSRSATRHDHLSTETNRTAGQDAGGRSIRFTSVVMADLGVCRAFWRFWHESCTERGEKSNLLHIAH